MLAGWGYAAPRFSMPQQATAHQTLSITLLSKYSKRPYRRAALEAQTHERRFEDVEEQLVRQIGHLADMRNLYRVFVLQLLCGTEGPDDVHVQLRHAAVLGLVAFAARSVVSAIDTPEARAVLEHVLGDCWIGSVDAHGMGDKRELGQWPTVSNSTAQMRTSTAVRTRWTS